MKKISITVGLMILLIASSNPGFAQNRISGFVKDSITKEVLVGAYIIDSLQMRVASTDNSGYFSISTKSANLWVSFVGYDARSLKNHSASDSLVVVLLSPKSKIDEVQVFSSRRINHNTVSIKGSELQFIPSLGAKPDVMKAIQLLPGVQSQNEGASTILVRGGNPGENLYLFDNVALIYVNHLGGFMSVLIRIS